MVQELLHRINPFSARWAASDNHTLTALRTRRMAAHPQNKKNHVGKFLFESLRAKWSSARIGLLMMCRGNREEKFSTVE
jgi:hypothetical protein